MGRQTTPPERAGELPTCKTKKQHNFFTDLRKKNAATPTPQKPDALVWGTRRHKRGRRKSICGGLSSNKLLTPNYSNFTHNLFPGSPCLFPLHLTRADRLIVLRHPAGGSLHVQTNNPSKSDNISPSGESGHRCNLRSDPRSHHRAHR